MNFDDVNAIFFAHTDIAYGSYIKMIKKIHKEKLRHRHAVSKTASISKSFLQLSFTSAVNWFGNLVSCIDTTIPRLVSVKYIRVTVRQGQVYTFH